MKKFTDILCVTFFACFLSACGDGRSDFSYTMNQNYDEPIVVSFLTEQGQTLPPYGYVDFCMRSPQQCPEQKYPKTVQSFDNTKPTATANIVNNENSSVNLPVRNAENLLGNDFSGLRSKTLSYQNTLSRLENVNNLVNRFIKPVTDIDGFGVTENWRIPDISGTFGDIGDCEDYALLKRKILSEQGFDYKKLSMSVVKQPDGTVHAILLVRTEFGDFVLDNLESDVKLWNDTPYKWVKKQSLDNPSIWVSVG